MSWSSLELSLTPPWILAPSPYLPWSKLVHLPFQAWLRPWIKPVPIVNFHVGSNQGDILNTYERQHTRAEQKWPWLIVRAGLWSGSTEQCGGQSPRGHHQCSDDATLSLRFPQPPLLGVLPNEKLLFFSPHSCRAEELSSPLRNLVELRGRGGGGFEVIKYLETIIIEGQRRVKERYKE